MNNVITLSGILVRKYDDWVHLYLKQEDGYLIDLIGRAREMELSFPDATWTICYYKSPIPLPKEKIQEELLKRLHGSLEADYEAEHWDYGGQTGGGVYHHSILNIGGHDLFGELEDHVNYFVLIEFEHS